MTEEEARIIVENAKPIDLSAFTNTIDMSNISKKKNKSFNDIIKKWQKKKKQKPEDNC